jgi:hypothetical protein
VGRAGCAGASESSAAIFEILFIVFSLKPSKNRAARPVPAHASRSALRISRASAGRNSGRT